MAQWQVRDVMTTNVITVADDGSVVEIAAILAGRGFSAVPIVDRFDVVIGLVSWTDLHDKIDIGEPEPTARGVSLRRWRAPRLRWTQALATDVMSAPPVTIRPDASLAAAGRAMHRRKIDRLLVVDDDRLVGIVTRGDLLKVHNRLDAVIRDEVMQRILGRTMMLEPGTVSVTVDDGLVTLAGHTARKTTGLAVAGLTAAVPGVTGVVDRMSFDVDDTIPAPAPLSVAHDPLRGWWVGPRRNQPASPAATRAVRDRGRLPAHADQAAGSRVSR